MANQEATAFLVSLFPSSFSKIVVVGGEDYQSIDSMMCPAPDFGKYFESLYKQYDTIKEVYILGGPDDYTEPFIAKMKKIVSDKVKFIKEG